jgi:hypothetical protein
MGVIRWSCAAVMGLSTPAAPAFAAGGAHVIDDGAVETPGLCHLEQWLTRSAGDGWLVTLAPACTDANLPNLEIGGAFTHAWNDDRDDTSLTIAPKVALRDEKRSLGVAVDGSLSFNVDDGRFDAASVIVPVTLVLGAWRLNANGGWTWSRLGLGHSAFAGAQAEWQVAPGLGLMIEGFGRNNGKAGFQAGLRWTGADGAVDLDCLAGRYLDGATPTAITIGLTIRR